MPAKLRIFRLKRKRNRSWREGRTAHFTQGHAIVAAIGLLLLAVGCYKLAGGLYSYTWPTTQGRVVDRFPISVMALKGHRTAGAGVYTYTPEGHAEPLQGEWYYFSDPEWETGNPLGAGVTVAYCPFAPHVALIEPGPTGWHLWWCLLGATILTIGLMPIHARKRALEAEARQLEARQERRAGGGRTSRRPDDGLSGLDGAGGGFLD